MFLLTKAAKIFLLLSDDIHCSIIPSVCKPSIKNILNSNHDASFSEHSSLTFDSFDFP